MNYLKIGQIYCVLTALLSYTLQATPGNIGGVKVNGSWNGVIGQLQRHVTITRGLLI